jgi:hypothetical protein
VAADNIQHVLYLPCLRSRLVIGCALNVVKKRVTTKWNVVSILLKWVEGIDCNLLHLVGSADEYNSAELCLYMMQSKASICLPLEIFWPSRHLVDSALNVSLLCP